MLSRNVVCLFWTIFCVIGDTFAEVHIANQVTEDDIRNYQIGINNLKEDAEDAFENAEIMDDSIIRDEQEYDFIIVGAGTAGLTLASRLAEVSSFKILVLEAGNSESDITKIPAMSTRLLSSKYNWKYFTTPQKNWVHGTEDRRSLLGMGKAIGGSTVINGMFWCRGDPADYDKWSRNDLNGWSYHDVLPYFKKVENASGVKYFLGSHQGADGPVNLENSRFKSRSTEFILRAAYELRIPYVNYNINQSGIGHAQGTLKSGRRWTAASAYLKEKLNLTIRKRSYVTKLLISEKERKAFGVKYLQNGQMRESFAKKEVILSAGGFMTPKLLIQSGIGPKDDLINLQLPVLADLPVGKQLITHPVLLGLKFILNEITLPKEDQREDLKEYLEMGTGPLTAFSVHLVAFFKINSTTKLPNSNSDYELAFVPSRKKTKDGDKLAISVNIVLLHPRSRGSVRVADVDPFGAPLIDPNFFSDEGDQDMKVMIEGIRKTQQFMSTRIFTDLETTMDMAMLPECPNEEFDSDEFWKCVIQKKTVCLSDAAATAKMGSSITEDAVVDDKLRVRGIDHLRVVDNSVIPVSLAAHMMAPAYMIGEKAADILKNHWNP